MQTATQIATSTEELTPMPDLFRGFRFRFCRSQEDWEGALAVRRTVYRRDCGYDVPVPDEYDGRSWAIVAEDTTTGQVVGTMRLTPRWTGRVEAEEYFALPRHLRIGATCEITRFAILPEYRKGKTFVPVVSVGLFKLVCEFAQRVGIRHLVVCSKKERLWTYEWLRFRTTGLRARYEKLGDAEHELVTADVERVLAGMADHPFGALFRTGDYEEIEVPERVPAPGMPWHDDLEPVAVGL